MPPKVRELVRALRQAGFVERGGKGSHRNFSHPIVRDTVTVSGRLGSDARPYQVLIVRKALKEATNEGQ